MSLGGVRVRAWEDFTRGTTGEHTDGTVNHRDQAVVVGVSGVIGGFAVARLPDLHTVEVAR
jgi:hypothetical protein